MGRMRDGTAIYTNLITTDDGVRGLGGSAAVLAAAYGDGKSTLLLQTAQLLRWVDNHYSKKEYFENPFEVPLYQTTVLWFPSSADHWTAFLPTYSKKCFPKDNPKKFLLHYHEGDPLTFWESPAEGVQQPMVIDPELVRLYHDERDLYATVQREGEGKVNVVFPPQDYHLSGDFVKTIQKMIGLSRARREQNDKRERYRPIEEIEVEPHVFYHQFIHRIMEEKDSRHLAIVYDDVTRFIQAYQTDVNFHLINLFAARWFPAMRKRNVSFYCSTHDLALIDWKVLDRFKTYFWFTSSIVSSRLSDVWRSAVRHLPKGKSIIEDRTLGYGWIPYRRIPNQPPVVITKGLAV